LGGTTDGSQDDQLQIRGIPAIDLVIGGGSVINDSGESGSGSGGGSLHIKLESSCRFIPINGDDTDGLEYTWVIEDYVHTTFISSSITRP